MRLYLNGIWNLPLLKQVDHMPKGLLYLSDGLVCIHSLVCVWPMWVCKHIWTHVYCVRTCMVLWFNVWFCGTVQHTLSVKVGRTCGVCVFVCAFWRGLGSRNDGSFLLCPICHHPSYLCGQTVSRAWVMAVEKYWPISSDNHQHQPVLMSPLFSSLLSLLVLRIDAEGH